MIYNMKRLSERRCFVLKAKQIAIPWKRLKVGKTSQHRLDFQNGKIKDYFILRSLVIFCLIRIKLIQMIEVM